MSIFQRDNFHAQQRLDQNSKVWIDEEKEFYKQIDATDRDLIELGRGYTSQIKKNKYIFAEKLVIHFINQILLGGL